MPITSSYAGQAPSENIPSHAKKLILKYYQFIYRNCPPVLPFEVYFHTFPLLQLLPLQQWCEDYFNVTVEIPFFEKHRPYNECCKHPPHF
jgi:hypothetical protein